MLTTISTSVSRGADTRSVCAIATIQTGNACAWVRRSFAIGSGVAICTNTGAIHTCAAIETNLVLTGVVLLARGGQKTNDTE